MWKKIGSVHSHSQLSLIHCINIYWHF